MLKEFTVGQVMAASWPAVPATAETNTAHIVPWDTVFHAVEQMEASGTRHLPVIQNGMVVGVIGREQIARLARARRPRRFFWTRK